MVWSYIIEELFLLLFGFFLPKKEQVFSLKGHQNLIYLYVISDSV